MFGNYFPITLLKLFGLELVMHPSMGPSMHPSMDPRMDPCMDPSMDLCMDPSMDPCLDPFMDPCMHAIHACIHFILLLEAIFKTLILLWIC